MTELGPELVAELEALAPWEAVEPRWHDVGRRAGPAGRRRSVARPLVAALVLAVGLGTAVNAAFGWSVSPFWSWFDSYPPGRTGPIVTVFSGPDWNLVAWKSTKGVCTSYGAPGIAGSGCEPLPTRPLAVDGWGSVSRRVGRIIGTVSARVVRVEVRFAGGRAVPARLSRRLPELGTARRYFLAEGPFSFTLGRSTRFVVVAYDSSGRQVGRFSG